MSSIEDLRGSERGLVYVLGCSGHLDRLRYRELVRSHPSIGISRVVHLVETRWLLFSDQKKEAPVLEECYTAALRTKSTLLLWRGLRPFAERWLRGRDIYYWDAKPKAPPSRSAARRLDKAFPASGNSITYAIESAALMGFTEIRLVGFDMVYGVEKSHCVGNWKQLRGCYPPKLTYLMPHVKQLYEKLLGQGVKVINESPVDGPLDSVFPREESPWLMK